MAQQTINIGSAGDDGTGDPLRTAFDKVNDNDTELYAAKTVAETHAANTSNPHSVTKSQVGLDNADNTSDANKPVSTAQQTALDLKQDIANDAVALVGGATIDLTGPKHTLATATGRTFTISHTGDDITLVITLSATSATMTFPAAALCVSDGTESGDNTCDLSGASGDKYVIAIKKVGSAYYVVSKNFGQ
jgi:hypothetical protein